jgi:hypothetical protein
LKESWLCCSSGRFGANDAIRDSSVGHSPQIPIRPGRQRCIDPSRAFSMHIFSRQMMPSKPSYKHLFLVLRLALFYVDRNRPFSIYRSSFLFLLAVALGILPLAHFLSVTT